MSSFNVTTIGSALKDITFYSDQGKVFATPQNLTSQRMLAFEYGAKITPNYVSINLGGGALNVAVSLSKLGLKTAIVTNLGQDESGEEILKVIKNEKINANYSKIDKKNPTGFSFILATDKKEKEHVAFTCRGSNDHLVFKSSQVKSLKSDWLYLSSLCGKNWLRNVKSIFEFALAKNSKVAWNPGTIQLQAGKKILSPFLKKTEILILNKDEAIELVLSGIKLGKKNPNQINRPIYLLNLIQEWGPNTVVITDSERGSWVYDGNKIFKQKGKKSNVLDTTGVGDSFASAFLAGLIYNRDNVEVALKWAAVNSASVLTKIGAQNGLLSLNEIKSKLK